MELVAEHASKRIEFILIMLVVGASFVVLVMGSSTCGDCDSMQLLDAGDG